MRVTDSTVPALILKNVLKIITALLIVSFLVFLLLDLSGADAAVYISGDRIAAGEEAIRENLLLDRNIFYRYFIFLLNFVSFSWGESIYAEDIASLIFSRLPLTLFLSLSSLFVSLVISILLALFLARSRASRALDVYSLIIFSLPPMVLALFLALLFSIRFPLLPVSGNTAIPVAVLSLMHSALFMRIFKKEVLSELDKDYVRTALSYGKSWKKIMSTDVFKNASRTLFPLSFSSFSSMLLGSAVLETMFSLPGFGSLIVSSAMARDVNLVATAVMLISLFVSILSLLSDICLYFLDPQSRRNNE